MEKKDLDLLKWLLKNKKISLKKYNKIIKYSLKLNKKEYLKKLEELIDNLFDYNLNEKEKYEVNKYLLLKNEKKKYDYLYCSEIGRFDFDKNGKRKTIFDFKTLYEWDKDWWKFQKKSLISNDINKSYKYKSWYKQNFKKYKNIYADGEWFRWIEKKDFGKDKNEMIYGSISGLYGYIIREISEFIDKEIDKIYPNFLYKPYNEKTFKKIKGSKYSTMYDFQTRAAGKEKELEKLKENYRNNFYKIEKEIENRIKPFSEYTFTNITYDYGKEKVENHMKHMIIGGISAAKKIRFKHFLKDFYEKEQPYGVVENIIKNLKKEIKNKYLKEWNEN